MKKKNMILLVLGFIFTFIMLGGFIGVSLMSIHSKTDNKTESVKKIKSSRDLSMMLETGSNTGIYEMTTRSTWPTEGYLFNAELSKCENGGKLSWNEENNTVIMTGNVSDKCYVYFDVYTLAVINSISGQLSSSSIKVTVNATEGTKPISKYYYSKDNGTTYVESSSNAYTFTGLSSDTSYNISVYAVDEKGKSSAVYSKTEKTIPPTVADYCSSGTNLATCIKTFGNQGTQISNIQIHNSSLSDGAKDNSYRFSGGEFVLTNKATATRINTIIDINDNVLDGMIDFYCNGTKKYFGASCRSTYPQYYTLNYDTTKQFSTYELAFEQALTDGYLKERNINNYVCFGSSATPCPADNLYRIIGTFESSNHGLTNQSLVKLVKADYANSNLLGTSGTYYGADEVTQTTYKGTLTTVDEYRYSSSESTNAWSSSALYSTNLNTNFLNSIGTTWSNKITSVKWKVGSKEWDNIGYNVMKTIYTYEVGSSATSTTVTAKIGLMYSSDYGYGARSSYYWANTYGPEYTNATEDNWLYLGLKEWLITPVNNTNTPVATSIWEDGGLSGDPTSMVLAIRPTFYLNSSVTYVSGMGTKDNPIRVN